MNVQNFVARAAGVAVLSAAIASAPAFGQSQASFWGPPSATNPPIAWNASPMFSSASYGNRDTWHVVLIVSVVVLAVGLIQNDSTLTILGGAGTLVSLIESGGNGFHYDPLRYGNGLVKTGPLFFGINPYGQAYRMPGDDKFRPSGYIGLTFKY